MRIYSVFVAFMSVTPNAIEQIGTAKYTARVPRKIVEQIKFPRRQVNVTLSKSDLTTIGIYRQRAGLNFLVAVVSGVGLFLQAFYAPEYCTYACNQFKHAKGFG